MIALGLLFWGVIIAAVWAEWRKGSAEWDRAQAQMAALDVKIKAGQARREAERPRILLPPYYR